MVELVNALVRSAFENVWNLNIPSMHMWIASMMMIWHDAAYYNDDSVIRRTSRLLHVDTTVWQTSHYLHFPQNPIFFVIHSLKIDFKFGRSVKETTAARGILIGTKFSRALTAAHTFNLDHRVKNFGCLLQVNGNLFSILSAR